MKGFIEKGTKVFIYGIEWAYEQQLTDFEITLGEDILKSDEEYVNYNGSLVVSEQEVKNAVIDYIRHEYPEIHDYMIDYE